jgi:hypothetical protein
MAIKELFRNGDDLYIVLRKIPLHNFKVKGSDAINPDLFNAWKEYLGADKVLKQNETFLFCETVPEAEIITEINEES